MAKPKAKVVAKPAKRAARDAIVRDSAPPAIREKLEVTIELPVPAPQLYEAWLDGREHSAFTGGQASVEPRVGGRFSAWGGYIEGETLELEPGRRIVQSWRTTDFEDADPDSRLEVRFEPSGAGTRVVVAHTELPTGGALKYREGWKQFYFTPMKQYFSEK